MKGEEGRGEMKMNVFLCFPCYVDTLQLFTLTQSRRSMDTRMTHPSTGNNAPTVLPLPLYHPPPILLALLTFSIVIQTPSLHHSHPAQSILNITTSTNSSSDDIDPPSKAKTMTPEMTKRAITTSGESGNWLTLAILATTTIWVD